LCLKTANARARLGQITEGRLKWHGRARSKKKEKEKRKRKEKLSPEIKRKDKRNGSKIGFRRGGQDWRTWCVKRSKRGERAQQR